MAGQHWWRRRVRAIWTTRCALSRLYAFFRRLDEIGAYDPSLIFVVSDHGHPKIPLSAEGTSPPLPDPPDASTPPGIEMPAGGVPLFLVKQPGDREPMRVSDVPVSLCDVPASIVDALGLDGRFECHSIFAAAEERPRPREHFRLEGRSKWQPPYRVSRWIVDGHSWRPSSWRPAPLP